MFGGFGNQLFQYAFGFYLQRTLKCKVFYINALGQPAKTQNHLLSFLSVPNENFNSKAPFRYYFSPFYRIIRKAISIFPFLSHSICIESFDKLLMPRSFSYKLYDGYWQDLRFIISYWNDLHPLLEFSNVDIFEKSAFVKKIKKSSVSIAVHIRRGDYLKSKVHAVLEADYYHNSFEYFKKKYNDLTFFVFTNDMNWVKENFAQVPNIVFIDHANFENSDLFDFYCMTLCNHQVIANSTFSWWSAYLNKNKDKIIIAPLNWYLKNDALANRIIPSEWIRM